ncbi:hypothetical protein MTO96_025789 [Rhipicephalus appendiculatus]
MVVFLGLPEWLILALTVCVLWYLYATRDRNYWKNQNVPSEPLSLIFSPSLQLLYKPIHAIDAARYNKYGRFFGAFESKKLFLFVAEPELVKQTNEFVTKTRQAFSERLTLRLFLFLLFPALAKMIRLRPFNSEIFLYFKRICQNIIKSRQDKQSHHEDFLQLMMDAQEGKLTSASENTAERDNQLFNLGSDVKLDTSFSTDRTLTENEAMAQCVLFFTSGHDTISSVISFTLYLLAIHPEVQEKLREEVDECFRTHGEHPSLDAVTKLKYLHCVVSESLRMYPPATR